MTLLAYAGENVVLYNMYKHNESKVVESLALSDEELLKLHELTHGGQHGQEVQ
jgi:hypothetical protein